MFTIKFNFDQLIEALKAYYLKYYSESRAKQGIEALYFLEGCEIADSSELLEDMDFENLAEMIIYEPEKLMTEEEAEEYLNQ